MGLFRRTSKSKVYVYRWERDDGHYLEITCRPSPGTDPKELAERRLREQYADQFDEYQFAGGGEVT